MAAHPDPRRKDDLEQIARRAMTKYGFLPDFSTDAFKELEAIQQSDRMPRSPAIDLRHLPWSSIDNDDSLSRRSLGRDSHSDPDSMDQRIPIHPCWHLQRSWRA